MEKVLITGGTGFVGTHLVSFLKSRGSQVAILAASGCSENTDLECYQGDVRDADTVFAAIHEFKPNYIYHLAAVSAVDLSWRSPRLTYEVNVFGTLNVFEAAMSLAAPPKVLNISTAQVYAPSISALNESSALAPDNPYAASKATSEFLSVQFRRQSEGGIVTARSFNHAGPGQSPDFVLSSIAKQFAEIEAGMREPKLVLGNIHVERDFTDVRDVVQAYSLLLQKGEVNGIYNVCSGHSRSIEEIVREFESVSGINIEIESHPGKQRAGENQVVCGDPTKIQAATGWRPNIPLKTTLQDLLAYWRAKVAENNRATPDTKPIERPLSSVHPASR
jgi:GDP-4-dehydro-6-deoxy-D-mannose reductase